MRIATLPTANRLTRRLFRLGDTDRLPLVLGARRVYILPTRQGLAFAMLLLGMLVGSINYGISLGFLFTFLLAGMGLACLFATWRNLLGLGLRGVDAEPVFAGDRLSLHLRLEPSPGLARRGLVLSRGADVSSSLDVAPGAAAELTLSLPTQARGRLALGTCQVGSVAPLGLFRAWAVLRLEDAPLVWPRPVAGHPPLPLGDAPAGEQDGRQVRGVEDFDGLRAYSPGESLSRLAWKTLARQSAPMVKGFVSPAGRQLWLDWGALGGREPEARLALLARWVLDADSAGQAWGLRLPGLTLAPAGGRAHRIRCLNALALVGQEQPAGRRPLPAREDSGAGEPLPGERGARTATVSSSPRPPASRDGG